MQISSRRLESDVDVLELSGRLVLGRECSQLEESVDGLVAQGPTKLVFDLAKMDYIDSTGLGILVSCVSKVKKSGGSLRLAGVSERVMAIIRVTNLDKVLAIDPTVADAVKAL